MNSQTLGLRVASVIFGLVCLGHLLRIVARLDVHIGGIYIHRWLSAVAVIASGLLCLWLWMLSRPEAKPAPGPEAR